MQAEIIYFHRRLHFLLGSKNSSELFSLCYIFTAKKHISPNWNFN